MRSGGRRTSRITPLTRSAGGPVSHSWHPGMLRPFKLVVTEMDRASNGKRCRPRSRGRRTQQDASARPPRRAKRSAGNRPYHEKTVARIDIARHPRQQTPFESSSLPRSERTRVVPRRPGRLRGDPDASVALALEHCAISWPATKTRRRRRASRWGFSRGAALAAKGRRRRRDQDGESCSACTRVGRGRRLTTPRARTDLGVSTRRHTAELYAWTPRTTASRSSALHVAFIRRNEGESDTGRRPRGRRLDHLGRRVADNPGSTGSRGEATRPPHGAARHGRWNERGAARVRHRRGAGAIRAANRRTPSRATSVRSRAQSRRSPWDALAAAVLLTACGGSNTKLIPEDAPGAQDTVHQVAQRVEAESARRESAPAGPATRSRAAASVGPTHQGQPQRVLTVEPDRGRLQTKTRRADPVGTRPTGDPERDPRDAHADETPTETQTETRPRVEEPTGNRRTRAVIRGWGDGGQTLRGPLRLEPRWEWAGCRRPGSRRTRDGALRRGQALAGTSPRTRDSRALRRRRSRPRARAPQRRQS